MPAGGRHRELSAVIHSRAPRRATCAYRDTHREEWDRHWPVVEAMVSAARPHLKRSALWSATMSAMTAMLAEDDPKTFQALRRRAVAELKVELGWVDQRSTPQARARKAALIATQARVNGGRLAPGHLPHDQPVLAG